MVRLTINDGRIISKHLRPIRTSIGICVRLQWDGDGACYACVLRQEKAQEKGRDFRNAKTELIIRQILRLNNNSLSSLPFGRIFSSI